LWRGLSAALPLAPDDLGLINPSDAGCAPNARRAEMIRKPLQLPPAVARNFVRDMRAFHVEPNATKRDEIAARQLRVGRAWPSAEADGAQSTFGKR
jgi:hypothetical protein